MNYITSAFEDYFRYLKSMKDAERSVQLGREKGDENPERRGEYYRSDAASRLEDCKDRLEKAKKYLDEIKARISA